MNFLHTPLRSTPRRSGTVPSENIDLARLWVNPDCGLKTRAWKETEVALKNRVTAAHNLRDTFSKKQVS